MAEIFFSLQKYLYRVLAVSRAEAEGAGAGSIVAGWCPTGEERRAPCLCVVAAAVTASNQSLLLCTDFRGGKKGVTCRALYWAEGICAAVGVISLVVPLSTALNSAGKATRHEKCQYYSWPGGCASVSSGNSKGTETVFPQ